MALNYYINQKGEIPNTALSMTDGGALERASRFHQTIPGYAPTPLVSLDHLAQRLGVAQVLVKDESRRFGLNAFKALGGSYAMARCLGQRLGWPEEKLTFEALMAPEVREKLGELTFVTATDGNHGRGVAWAAHKLGQKAVVHMPKGSSQARYENIAKEGAQVTIEEVNYDDCVRMAAAEAAVKAAKGQTKTIPMHTFSGPVEHAIAHIEESIQGKVDDRFLRWYAVKLFERDDKVMEELKLDKDLIAHIDEHIKDCASICSLPVRMI